MANIRDKIAKLLALSESPNENEARAALLKARALMAEHKLCPEEIREHHQEKVAKKTIGLTCTKMTNPWVIYLGNVIAKHYCCVVFRGVQHKMKTVTLGLVGFEEDMEVCEGIIRYAYSCIEARCRELRSLGRRRGQSGTEIRKTCNAYGYGFCKGLEAAYNEQSQKHQEWGLVLATPQPVLDAVNAMGKKTPFAKYDLREQLRDYAAMGIADGRRFDPGKRLPEQESREASA